MPYLGNPAVDRFTSTKAASVYSGNGSTTVAFTLEHSVGADEDILVSVDGVIQEPSVAYAVSSGTTLTFTAAPSSNSGNNIFVYYLFRTIGTVTHPPTSALSATSGTFSTTLDVTGAFTSQGIDDNADGTAITIDSSERVMIGTTTEGHADADNLTVSGSANSGITIRSGTSNQGQIFFSDGTSGDDEFRGIVGYNHSNNRLTLTSNAGAGTFELYSTGVQATIGNAAGAYIAVLVNDGNNADRYGMAISCGSDDASGTNYALRFADGDSGTQGYITFSGGTVTYGAFTAFHPCVIPNADNDADSQDNAYPYGTLLEITSLRYSQKNGADTERGLLYNVQKSSSAKSKAVIGAYGSSMNGGPDEETNMHQTLILGDGHILCNNENGNIAIGDYICTSSASGEGMKATSICTTIGVAREAVSFTNSTAKLVAVEYGYRQFVPEDLEDRIKALENA